MPESAPSITELLTLILGVLERVDEKLALHDEQTRHLTTNVSSKDGLHRNASLSDARHYLDFDDIAKPSIAFRACENGTPRVPKRPGKLPYREWHLNQLEGPLDNDMVKLLQSHIGDWYKIPGDNRLPLSYSRYGRDHQFESETFSMSEYIHYSPPNYSLSRLKAARAFDETLRICNGCDFVVIDFDAQNHHILYRMGEEAIGTELLIPDSETIAENDLSAPWSRLILFQGMTTGNCLNPDTTAANNYKAPVPYFDQVSGGPGLWSHINTHLQNRGRSVTANPYDDEKLGFTTTFYEIIKERTEYHELWRHGPLYDDPLGRLFRKSSYTLYVLSSAHRGQDKRDGIYYTIGHWTMLVLSPSHFFDQSNTSFPMSAISPLDKPISGQFVGRLTKLGAEMNMIGQGLQRISDRWTDFQSFFEYILDSGDALMQPTKHDNLLFDDGSFSRSRRYFWAIDCLSEFEKNITDNLTQWELWRTARIEARVRAGALSELDMAQYRFVEQHYRVLSKQREYFRQKLALTVALRDADAWKALRDLQAEA
ncbi:hypothetical protein MMC13_006158 [Lambiella insularis]|nr:hypothetical protein [Lambiella insularis]